jgi:hypothetical protein
MSDLRDAAQQALEALEELNGWQSLAPPLASQAGRQAAISLRTALKQPAADRAAFERHAKSLGYSVDPDTRAGREGGYWSSHTHLMWGTWQAALEQPEQDTDCHAQGICQRSGYGIGQPEQVVPYAVWRQGFDAVRKYKEQPEQEPVAWACFKNGGLQTELVGTEADVDFWCASDEPEMDGMVKGALYTHPPRRECLHAEVNELKRTLALQQRSYEREIEIEVEAERASCIDDCNAEARDDGTAQRIVERIRARGNT